MIAAVMHAGSGSERRVSWVAAAAALALFAGTFVLFFPVGGFEFIHFDDDAYVTANPHIRDGITWESLRWAFGSAHAHNWHPLTWLSHLLDVSLFGLDPRGHHLVSAGLHAANALVLFLALHAMTGAAGRSAFVAALFAVHPLHIQSVAWVAERKDVLSALLWFLTMGAYAAWVRRPGTMRYVLVCLAFALGLMAKPMLVTLPFVLLLLDWWPLGRLTVAGGAAAGPAAGPRRERPVTLEATGGGGKAAEDPPGKAGRKRRKARGDASTREGRAADLAVRFRVWPIVREKIPLFFLAAVSASITYAVQVQTGAVKSFESYPLASRIANALAAYGHYLARTVWPADLAILYPHPRVAPWGEAALSFLVLAGITAAVLKAARRFPYAATGWFWFAGTLVPVIGLVQVGGQAMADRYTYVPLVGLFILASWGIPDLLPHRPWRRPVLALAAAAALVVLSFANRAELAYWKDSETLFNRAISVTRDNYLMHNNLGVVRMENGRLAEAETHFREVIRIHPHLEKPYTNLGNVLLRQGRIPEAEEALREALRRDPASAQAWANLGDAAAARGRAGEALAAYGTALERDPSLATAHYNRGSILCERGRLDEGVAHLRQAIRIRPDYARAHNNLGSALLLQGRTAEAASHFREALRLQPDYERAKSNLRDALAISEGERRGIRRGP